MTENERSPDTGAENEDLIKSLITTPSLTFNTSVDILVIMEDKVRIVLMEYLQRVEKKSGWKTPLAIFLTVLFTLVTASFPKEVLFLSGDSWKAIFVIVCILSGIWLVKTVWDAGTAETVDDIIKQFKSQAQPNLGGQSIGGQEN